MDNPNPTIEEQIKAVAVLRAFAKLVPACVNPTSAELEVVEAVNTLDNANLFAALDEEAHDREARPMISTQSAMNGKIYRPDGSVQEPPVGLPTLAPGEEVRPAFSDTHPRAARELGETIQGGES